VANHKRQRALEALAAKNSPPEEPWEPFQETAWLVTAEGATVPVEATGFHSVFRNNLYCVLLRHVFAPEPFGRGVHLSIRRVDRGATRDWRHFQRLKNEILGPEWEAVELFPAESRLVDGANQFHLWAFARYRFPFGFDIRDVRDVDDGLNGAVQRPLAEWQTPTIGGHTDPRIRALGLTAPQEDASHG